MKIEEVVLRPPVLVTPDCTIREAAEMMSRQGVGAVMVADGGGPARNRGGQGLGDACACETGQG